MGLPDPRTEGSYNPGATNVLRFGGKKAAADVFLRAVKGGESEPPPIEMADLEAVIGETRPSVGPSDLARFELYRKAGSWPVPGEEA